MKSGARYWFLQMKRVGKILPAVCLFTLVLCIGIGGLLYALVAENENDEKNIRFRIGVVGDTNESYLGFGISALQTLDSSRHTIEFAELTETEARTQLKDGTLDAYIVIPEDFVSAIVHGEVRQLQYVTTPQAADFSTLIRDELLDTVSVMLIESQKGLYGFIDAVDQVKAADRGEHLDRLNRQYFSMILSRDALCEVEIIGTVGGASLMGSLFCGLAVFYILLSGISFCAFFIRREKSLSCILRAAGMPVPVQIFCEYGAYVCGLFAVTVLPILLLCCTDAPAAWIPEWDAEYTAVFVCSTAGVMLCLAAMQFCLYELSSGVTGSILVQFIVSLAMAYVSGCLYPVYFFPETVQKISPWLPAGAAQNCLASALTGENAGVQWLVLLLYAAVFLGIAVLVRRKTMTAGTEADG
ncbi:MAG: ABC transporter permease [Clostridia bacterium]|nr:ABC transporter permease [Clostridia bacterium]